MKQAKRGEHVGHLGIERCGGFQARSCFVEFALLNKNEPEAKQQFRIARICLFERAEHWFGFVELAGGDQLHGAGEARLLRREVANGEQEGEYALAHSDLHSQQGASLELTVAPSICPMAVKSIFPRFCKRMHPFPIAT